MSTVKKPKPVNEYVYGYALSVEGEFYSASSGDVGPLEEADIYSEAELNEKEREAEKELGHEVERVAIIIREV